MLKLFAFQFSCTYAKILMLVPVACSNLEPQVRRVGSPHTEVVQRSALQRPNPGKTTGPSVKKHLILGLDDMAL